MATADRCKETTTTTGNSTITLDGAVVQHQSFANAFSVGQRVQYAIVEQSGIDWEVGEGTLLTSNTLSRDKVYSSSNSNALVNFGSGTKDIFATIIAEFVEHASLGIQYANANGWNMS